MEWQPLSKEELEALWDAFEGVYEDYDDFLHDLEKSRSYRVVPVEILKLLTFASGWSKYRQTLVP